MVLALKWRIKDFIHSPPDLEIIQLYLSNKELYDLKKTIEEAMKNIPDTNLLLGDAWK